MNNTIKPSCRIKARIVATVAAGVLASASSISYAIEFGPDGMFSLTGFAEVTTGLQSNFCLKCQVANADFVSKQIKAADAIIPGKTYQTVNTVNWQIQPYLGAKYDLGGGYEVSGLLSQRWRDGTVNGSSIEPRYGGKVDVPRYWYQKNIALKHENYGSVRIGSMTTRAWSVADYPYGSTVGVSEAWASSGAGYGMLASAIRVATPLLEVAEGDLFLELTYDRGNTNFKRLKPAFYELYAQYHKGDLVVDAMYQDATNGAAGAWGHAPFSGVTPYALDDSYVSSNGTSFGSNKQSIAMLMARYQYNSKIEVSGGIRRNSWSGANVVYNPGSNWTTAFNVDYTNPFAVSNPGVAATSVDLMAGLKYRMDKWTFSTGMVYLGKANTSNPSERGQSNSTLINTVGVRYEYIKGLQLQANASMVNYGRLGLSPMSQTSNSAYSGVDSRISRTGSRITVGIIYTF